MIMTPIDDYLEILPTEPEQPRTKRHALMCLNPIPSVIL